MTCKAVQNRLDAFADGELSGREMLGIREHLSRCPECGQELQSLKILKSDLARLPRAEAPAGLEERLLAVVAASEEARPKVARSRMRIAAALGVVAAVALFAGLQIRGERSIRAQSESERRFEGNVDRAITAAEDPLYGGTFMMPASYGR